MATRRLYRNISNFLITLKIKKKVFHISPNMFVDVGANMSHQEIEKHNHLQSLIGKFMLIEIFKEPVFIEAQNDMFVQKGMMDEFKKSDKTVVSEAVSDGVAAPREKRESQTIQRVYDAIQRRENKEGGVSLSKKDENVEQVAESGNEKAQEAVKITSIQKVADNTTTERLEELKKETKVKARKDKKILLQTKERRDAEERIRKSIKKRLCQGKKGQCRSFAVGGEDFCPKCFIGSASKKKGD